MAEEIIGVQTVPASRPGGRAAEEGMGDGGMRVTNAAGGLLHGGELVPSEPLCLYPPSEVLALVHGMAWLGRL
ncbi:hypothetical protein ACFVFJ_44140 [Streptomyces sp. NPDC057717]|uniref:hypothetical protein n=1 Tax=unclassified Streptomyces TaxID=2593676 RepID=UPI00363281EE